MPRKIFPLLLSEEEKAEIQEKASATGLKLSEYARAILIDGNVTSKRKSNIPKSHQKIYAGLSNISDALERLLCLLEENQWPPVEMAILREVEKSIQQLKDTVLGDD